LFVVHESRTDRLSFWLLLAIVAFAPLPFGAEAQWAWSLLTVLTGAGLLFRTIPALTGRLSLVLPAGVVRLAPAGALYALLLLWIALQASPWTPPAWHAPVWKGAAGALDTAVAGAISINPSDTLSGLARLICYGGVFFLAMTASASATQAIRLLRGIVAIVVAYAIYGLANELLGFNRILWLPKWRGVGNVTSTMLDSNAFATFAGLGLLAALTLLFRPKLREGDLSTGWRVAARSLLDYAFSRSWRSTAAAGLLFVTVILTHSRAGLAASAIAMMVLVLFATAGWARRKPALLVISVLVLAGGALFAISGAGTLERLHTAPAAAWERGAIYRVATEAIAERPLAGTGHRSFAEAFPAWRDETLPVLFDHAHNIYLETAMELGLIGAALLFGTIASLSLVCLRGRRLAGRDAALPCLGLAAVALVGIHALVDSTLRIPAVAILFAALMGIAAARGTDAGRRDR
jgi:O-antigen ligase